MSNVEAALTAELRLKDARFFLEKWGDRINGSVISPTFKKKRNIRRYELIREALEKVFGPIALTRVGMILAYTPDEWDPFRNPEPEPKPSKAKSRK
jgi:acid stress-induced BolA-like protein IbaG/YrbA